MKFSWRSFVRERRLWLAAAGATFVGAFAAVGPNLAASEPPLASAATWPTRAIPESQGVVKEVDGERRQLRYPWGGFGTANYEQWPTQAYGSKRFPPPQKAEMPAGLKGDPKKGHELIKLGAKGPCTGCHLIPDPNVWPMGNVGPDLRTIGSRGMPDNVLYQIIYDPRVLFGEASPMPPFGLTGFWKPQEIVDVVAYLQTLKAGPDGQPPKVTDDKQWNPFTRDVVRPEYGDQLDPTANPALLLTESAAVPLWSKPGPKGQSCESCHGKIEAADDTRPLGVIKSMVGVGVQYPKW
ncbi:MAG TPA: sulfur oxidation c-type cytochrome SoxX, partial [Burkholderiaceae bacterium]|nr:sulfur oxidation c-type cytochrome SoxX [Burkholderiaceae bacterium]